MPTAVWLTKQFASGILKNIPLVLYLLKKNFAKVDTRIF